MPHSAHGKTYQIPTDENRRNRNPESRVNSIETFAPAVWTSPSAPAILVCRNRWMHGKLSPAPKRPDKVPGRTCDQWHPVAIEIETGIVRFMFGGPEGATWDGDGKPDAWGFSFSGTAGTVNG